MLQHVQRDHVGGRAVAEGQPLAVCDHERPRQVEPEPGLALEVVDDVLVDDDVRAGVRALAAAHLDDEAVRRRAWDGAAALARDGGDLRTTPSAVARGPPSTQAV